MGRSIKRDLSKVNKVLHPRSRKAQKLHQKASRNVTVEKSKKIHKMRENLVGEKLLWFKERLVLDVKVYSSQMVLDIVEQYLARFDDELEQISVHHSIGHRKNRRYASREDILNMAKMHDVEEFDTCGLEIPDLMNDKELAYLRNWNGELRYLQNMHLKRYSRSKLLEGINRTKSKGVKEHNSGELMVTESKSNAPSGMEEAHCEPEVESQSTSECTLNEKTCETMIE